MLPLKRSAHVLPALLAVVVTGCQLRLATDVSVASDGSGTVDVAVEVDAELEELLAGAGVDLTEGLDEAIAAAGAWEVEEVALDDGFGVRFRSTFVDPAGFEAAVAELHEGLSPEDGALFDRLELDVDADGAVAFDGVAGLVLPTTTGAEGDGVEFDADDLTALLAARGDELVRAELRLTLPAAPTAHDADEVQGRSLTWRLPVGEQRQVMARSAAPAGPAWWLVGVVAAATALVVGGAVVAWRRRRAVTRAG